MKKISKELVDMIEERESLNRKIRVQMMKEMSVSLLVDHGVDTDLAYIVSHNTSDFAEDHYYETEYEGKYLH